MDAKYMPHFGKTFAWGLLLVPIWLFSLFLLSMIYHNEQPMDFVSANIISAIVVGLGAFMLGRKIRPGSRRELVITATVWVATVVLILFVIGWGNQTLNIIFGHWAMYLTYVGIVAGVWLSARRQTT